MAADTAQHNKTGKQFHWVEKCSRAKPGVAISGSLSNRRMLSEGCFNICYFLNGELNHYA